MGRAGIVGSLGRIFPPNPGHLLQILCPALDCPLALSIAGARSYPAIWNTIQGLLATIPNGKMQIAGAIPWQCCNMVLCHLEVLSQRCDGIPNGNLPLLVKHQLLQVLLPRSAKMPVGVYCSAVKTNCNVFAMDSINSIENQNYSAAPGLKGLRAKSARATK